MTIKFRFDRKLIYIVSLAFILAGIFVSTLPVQAALYCANGCYIVTGYCDTSCVLHTNRVACAKMGSDYTVAERCDTYPNGSCKGLFIQNYTCTITPHPCDGYTCGCGSLPPCCTETACVPPVPTDNYICYGGTGTADDGSCYKLSTNQSLPTIVRAPKAGERLYMKVSRVTPACVTNGVQYLLRIDSIPTAGGVGVYYAPDWTDNNYSIDIRGNSSWNAGSVYKVWGHTASKKVCTTGGLEFDPTWVTTIGYFKINSPTTLVSISPNSGISGTATDADNGSYTLCSDNNPQTFRAIYRDSDGVNNINFAGFWADNASPLTSSASGHGAIAKGAWIKINASGQCRLGCPDMKVTALGVDLGTISVPVVANNYYFYSSNPIALKDVTVTFTNDYVDAGGDRNLIINSIAVGVSKEGGIPYSTQAILYTPYSTITPPTSYSTVVGSVGYMSYGLSLNDWLINNTGLGISATPQYCGSPLSIFPPRSADTNYSSCALNSSTYTAVKAVTQLNPTDLAVDYQIEFLKDIGTNLVLYGVGVDSVGYDKPSTQMWVSGGNRTLDLQMPSETVSSFNIIDQNRASSAWTASDANGIIQTFGMLGLSTNVYPKATKDVFDETSGAAVLKLPGQELQNPVLDTVYVGPAWRGAINSRNEVFNISTLNSGDLSLRVYAIDGACNQSFNSGFSLTVSQPWFVTKGGFVYSGGAIIDPVQNLAGGPFNLPSATNFWASPFTVANTEANISTELLLSGASSVTTIPRASFNPYIFANYSYPSLFSHTSSSYTWLKENVNKISFYQIQRVDYTSATNLTGNVSNYCNDTTKDICAIFSTSNITASSLICNKKTLIMSDADIMINPEIINDRPNHGCIFIAGNNVVVGAGTYKSDSKTESQTEYLNGYFIAGNQVTIADVDVTQPLTDILKINGGLIAFGEGTGGISLNWNRSLRLKQNNSFPTFGVSYDPRYLDISSKFFDNSFSYVSDEGYKPY